MSGTLQWGPVVVTGISGKIGPFTDDVARASMGSGRGDRNQVARTQGERSMVRASMGSGRGDRNQLSQHHHRDIQLPETSFNGVRSW